MVDLKLAYGAYSDIVKAMKRERNAIDFEDMIEIVRDPVLKGPGPPARGVHRTLRFIMVDEFQDTDAIQSEIIWMVAGKRERPSACSSSVTRSNRFTFSVTSTCRCSASFRRRSSKNWEVGRSIWMSASDRRPRSSGSSTTSSAT